MTTFLEGGFSSARELLDKVNLEGSFVLDDECFWYDGCGEIVSGDVEDFLVEFFNEDDIAEWLLRECTYDDYSSLEEWRDERFEISDRIEKLEERIEELEGTDDDEDDEDEEDEEE